MPRKHPIRGPLTGHWVQEETITLQRRAARRDDVLHALRLELAEGRVPQHPREHALSLAAHASVWRIQHAALVHLPDGIINFIAYLDHGVDRIHAGRAGRIEMLDEAMRRLGATPKMLEAA